MTNGLLSKGVFTAMAIASTVAVTGLSSAAQADEAVQVTINVVGSQTARAAMQTTDFGDIGASCDSNNSFKPATNPCPHTEDYSNGPKNMKFMLCIVSKTRPIITDSCQQLLQVMGNCHSNSIWTSVCGLTDNGKETFGSHVIPQCEYRTNASKSEWTWTFFNDEQNLDCSMSDLVIHD